MMWKASCDYTCLPPVPFYSLQVLLLFATQCQLEPRSSCWGGALWRPCTFTPIHSLTGPMGQPFASRLGGQWFAYRGCTNSQWNRVSPVRAVLLQPLIYNIFNLSRVIVSTGHGSLSRPYLYRTEVNLLMWIQHMKKAVWWFTAHYRNHLSSCGLDTAESVKTRSQSKL